VADASWSRYGEEDCVLIRGVPASAAVRVRPYSAAANQEFPPMAGRLVRDGADTCFLPRYPFVAGTAYAVTVDGLTAAVLVRHRSKRTATTGVLGICPTAREVPRNLLRFYVWFSAPMSEGYAAGHVRLRDDAGVMAGALLSLEHELWDADHRRLTVLLDPARIKRGLVPHEQAGYPLRSGTAFRLEVDDGFRDARGVPLAAGAERTYWVGADERRRVDPDAWTVTPPTQHSVEPVMVQFGRSLDHGLLARCLHVAGPDGRPIWGRAEAGPAERWWRLIPSEPWAEGTYCLVVDPILEDVAGNSMRRVFDRDRSRPEDRPGRSGPGLLRVPFQPAAAAPGGQGR
jgi:hypothetical protein